MEIQRNRRKDAYKYPDEQLPSERTVYRIMQKLELIHRPKRKPNGIAKADREARTSDDLLKRDFTADRPYTGDPEPHHRLTA